MKKWSFLLVLAIVAGLALLLAGCGKKEAAVANGNVNDADDRANGQPALPLFMQLALGTLKLDGTDQAVTSEQAAELLPLWKAANSLSDADNVTPQELEGLFKQIQKAMTPEQMQSIQSMDLSGPNMAEIARELGLDLPQGGPGNLSEEQQATLEAARESGQMPRGEFGGGPPPGGMPGGGEGGFPPGGEPQEFSQNNNPAARQAGRGSFGTAIYQAVIDLLEKKIQ
jgi:hypothetical protein